MFTEQLKKEARRKAHGAISISFILTSLGIAFGVIIHQSLLFGLIYLAVVLLSFIVMAVVYCSKCLCRDNCNHIFMGKLSKIFSKKSSKKYSWSTTVFGAVMPFSTIFIFAQFWLVNNFLYFSIFWILTIMGVLDIVIFVCPNCDNTKCSMCSNSKK